MPKILFVAGDLSGDMHAARVAEHIKRQAPGVEILALGGPALKAAAHRFLYDLVDQSVMGFWEPIKKLPQFWRILNGVIKPALRDLRPDVVVPTDFFGFNRFTAAAAKAAGCRVDYFIGPQVWASREGRVRVLRRAVDKLLLIFPFEEEFYRRHGVPAVFVGHPLLEEMPAVSETAALRPEPVVGLLPGSRRSEVRRHLPLFLKAADILSTKIPGVRFVLFAAPSLTNDFYDGLLGRDTRRPFLLEIVRDEDYNWRSGLDFALTCSGTATLENALLGVPMAVVYKTSWPTYALARALVKVDRISMANILAGKDLAPELIQGAATPERLAQASLEILRDPARRRELRRELLSLRGKLGGPGASARAAAEILKDIK